jgi:hypothetical protein
LIDLVKKKLGVSHTLSNLQKGADLAASNGVYNMNGNSSKELGDSLHEYLLMSDRDLFF